MPRNAFAGGWYGLMALSVALAAGADAASDAKPAGNDETQHVLRSAGGYSRDRDPNELRDALTLEETRPAKTDRAPRTKTGGLNETLTVLYGDHWVYDAGVDLFYDTDGDGYYHYMRVWFDVDSYFDPAYAFARLYLGDGEGWELYYETDDFTVLGQSPDDQYEVETELVSDYPPGLYDVLIEIYDADTGTLVDEYGPAQSSVLSLLPLEDTRFDGVRPPATASHGHGGGGAVSWLGLGLLGAAAARRLAVAARRSSGYA